MKLCKKKLHLYPDDHGQCLECHRLYKQQWRKDNANTIKYKNKLSYLKNKDILQKKNKLYRENNKEKLSIANKKWINQNKEKVKAIKDRWLEKNPEKRREVSRNWGRRNLDYYRKKRKNDIYFRLKSNLRNRLVRAIKNAKNDKKLGSAVKDLGCTIQQFKNHLESLFQPGMTWDNYGRGKGKWSIDHIIALSTVDLTDLNCYKKINHFSNLRPLWNKDQLSTYHREQRSINE